MQREESDAKDKQSTIMFPESDFFHIHLGKSMQTIFRMGRGLQEQLEMTE